MIRPTRDLPALLALLLIAPSAAAEPAPSPSEVANGVDPLSPPRLSAMDGFLDAIAIDREIVLAVDSFWQPAIEALVAANPGKIEAARTFAAARRAQEIAVYRPIVARELDSNLVELFYPEVRKPLLALADRIAKHARTLSDPAEAYPAYAQEARRILAGPEKQTDTDLVSIAALARTPEGAALRDLLRQGYFWCAKLKGRIEPGMEADCARLGGSPALLRLKKANGGEKLIVANAAAYAQLMAWVAMAHGAGISLHRLLPTEELAAAGLKVPEDLSFEQLLARHRPSAGAQ